LPPTSSLQPFFSYSLLFPPSALFYSLLFYFFYSFFSFPVNLPLCSALLLLFSLSSFLLTFVFLLTFCFFFYSFSLSCSHSFFFLPSSSSCLLLLLIPSFFLPTLLAALFSLYSLCSSLSPPPFFLPFLSFSLLLPFFFPPNPIPFFYSINLLFSSFYPYPFFHIHSLCLSASLSFCSSLFPLPILLTHPLSLPHPPFLTFFSCSSPSFLLTFCLQIFPFSTSPFYSLPSI